MPLLATALLTHPGTWWMAQVGALLIGMAKAGLAGFGMVSVALFAEAFGGKESTGLVLPLLIAADIMGYMVLRRGGGSWKQIIPLAPPACVGVVIGWVLLDRLPHQSAARVIGWMIIGLLALKLVLDWKREQLKSLHRHPVFTWFIGITAGLVTMLANAAGPVMAIYLLAHRFEKGSYLGIFSRFFLFMNLFKVPFSANIGLINADSLMTNLTLLPAVVIGVLIGWPSVKLLSQRTFEWLILVFAFAAALKLIV